MTRRATRYGRCPRCSRTVALSLIGWGGKSGGEMGMTRNHLWPNGRTPADNDIYVGFDSRRWCRGGRTDALSEHHSGRRP